MVQADSLTDRRGRGHIEAETRNALDSYFVEEIHTKEMAPICLLGCGEAGTSLAGYFRLKPDYVPAYLPQFFPVRAIAMDTQGDIHSRLKNRLGWDQSNAQLHIPPPDESLIRTLLEKADAASGTLPDGYVPPEAGGIASRSGGAGGFTLRGRATGLHHFGSDSALRDFNTDILERERLLSRGHAGYLLTFSGLGGGTGSGAVPVVAHYIQQRLEPAPLATFSLCVVPEGTSGNLAMPETSPRDPRLLSNLLCSLYYMASTHAINGVILSDNMQVEAQGHKGFENIDLYLQDILMPVFLSSQSYYVYDQVSPQLDPANVRLVMAPGENGTQDFIAACFSRSPLDRDKAAESQAKSTLVPPDPVTGVPNLERMLDVALRNPTIDCDTGSARAVLALLSGPESALRKMVPDVSTLVNFDKNVLLPRCIGDEFRASADQQGWSRFFVAQFPQMTDVRLTVLLRAPRFRALEYALKRSLADEVPDWDLEGNETLAGALRRLDELTVRKVGLGHANTNI